MSRADTDLGSAGGAEPSAAAERSAPPAVVGLMTTRCFWSLELVLQVHRGGVIFIPPLAVRFPAAARVSKQIRSITLQIVDALFSL